MLFTTYISSSMFMYCTEYLVKIFTIIIYLSNSSFSFIKFWLLYFKFILGENTFIIITYSWEIGINVIIMCPLLSKGCALKPILLHFNKALPAFFLLLFFYSFIFKISTLIFSYRLCLCKQYKAVFLLLLLLVSNNIWLNKWLKPVNYMELDEVCTRLMFTEAMGLCMFWSCMLLPL